ncbi:hypothetical protein Ssi03_76150 [Sphaerisporangium siamense]|uniref:HK97 gp10 family phage protein n=1 Tax=Sphaerisporangium siamense TaxID=795645 RepID=A0A7W7G8A3_9ACTN|nr:HK97 gp10 family phage protein [Sphaerisporangium siamense]MBB4699295.1 hypothetical protein [Sphaerisporangium siamense]GII89625.1 hypothetical protein Ssi03_76150 [Sphaerisporangium siamense]
MSRSGSQELRLFIRDLGKLPPAIRQELRPRLRTIGQSALAAVRARASWSRRIPAATRLSVSLSKTRPGVSIVVNKTKAPHARPYENAGQPGTFRHPVFGNRDRWVSQAARPFLWPAARPHFERVDEQIGQAVDEVARRHGFR